jgi:hypothetical protein
MVNKILSSMIKDFSYILSAKQLNFDISWKKALCSFSNVLNKEINKEKVETAVINLLQNI